MGTEVIQVDPGHPDDAIARAAALLDAGGLVVFPTETVYGVAARADFPQAVARLREVKSRHDSKPFTVHLPTRETARDYLSDIDELALRFFRKAWPGPLTLVLPTRMADSPLAQRLSVEAAEALAFENTIGLRCPDDTVCHRVLAAAGGPVVASSANAAGAEPPRSGGDVLKTLDGKVDLVLDVGKTRYAHASTIVRIHGKERYEILREGVYDRRMIDQFAQLGLLFVCTGNTCRSPMAEAIARNTLEQAAAKKGTLQDRRIHVSSAGTFGGGGGASEHAVSVMRERGLDISEHRSRPLTAEMVHHADYIFAMTHSHRDAILHLVPAAADKVLLLAGEGDIGDPYGGSKEAYQRCAQDIEAALLKRLQEIEL